MREAARTRERLRKELQAVHKSILAFCTRPITAPYEVNFSIRLWQSLIGVGSRHAGNYSPVPCNCPDQVSCTELSYAYFRCFGICRVIVKIQTT